MCFINSLWPGGTATCLVEVEASKNCVNLNKCIYVWVRHIKWKKDRKKASGKCQKMWIMMAFIEIHTYIMYVSQKKHNMSMILYLY